MHTIEISISTTKWFDTQKQMAEFLGIKNTSKKSISSRCRVYGYGVNFNEYTGELNINKNIVHLLA